MKRTPLPEQHGFKLQSEDGQTWLTIALCPECDKLHGSIDASDPAALRILLRNAADFMDQLLESLPVLDPANETQH